MAPKRRRSGDGPAPSSSAPVSGRQLRSASRIVARTAPCLLSLLQPVRYCLHPLLSEKDAVRLLQTSHSTAALLDGYAFTDSVFTFHTAAELKRVVAFYSRYRMAILRVSLGSQWSEPLIDSDTGQPLLPASLLALTLCQTPDPPNYRPKRRCAANAPLDASDSSLAQEQSDEDESENESEDEREEEEKEEGDSDSDDERWFHRRIRPVDAGRTYDRSWNVCQYDHCYGEFNLPIPPGALPSGLRFLQLNSGFNRPLQAGSIPDSVEVLQFGQSFNQPLAAGHLPASLTHLVLVGAYNQPLLTGVLPAGLRRLRMGFGYKQPLEAGVLPPQLEQLSLGSSYNQRIAPDVIPPSVTHVRLGYSFNQPLQAGSIPHGVTMLHLGNDFDWPLLTGVLPSSLRELLVSTFFTQPLLPGSLPDGLEVLAFHEESEYNHALHNALPASVRVLSLGEELMAGHIPSTVKWLRLSGAYQRDRLVGVVSPTTGLVRWPQMQLW